MTTKQSIEDITEFAAYTVGIRDGFTLDFTVSGDTYSDSYLEDLAKSLVTHIWNKHGEHTTSYITIVSDAEIRGKLISYIQNHQLTLKTYMGKELWNVQKENDTERLRVSREYSDRILSEFDTSKPKVRDLTALKKQLLAVRFRDYEGKFAVHRYVPLYYSWVTCDPLAEYQIWHSLKVSLAGSFTQTGQVVIDFGGSGSDLVFSNLSLSSDFLKALSKELYEIIKMIHKKPISSFGSIVNILHNDSSIGEEMLRYLDEFATADRFDSYESKASVKII